MYLLVLRNQEEWLLVNQETRYDAASPEVICSAGSTHYGFTVRVGRRTKLCKGMTEFIHSYHHSNKLKTNIVTAKLVVVRTSSMEKVGTGW